MSKIFKEKTISPFAALSKEIRLLKQILLKTPIPDSLAQEIETILKGFEQQKEVLLRERSSEKIRHRLKQSYIFQKELSSPELLKSFILQGPLFNLNNTVYRG